MPAAIACGYACASRAANAGLLLRLPLGVLLGLGLAGAAYVAAQIGGFALFAASLGASLFFALGAVAAMRARPGDALRAAADPLPKRGRVAALALFVLCAGVALAAFALLSRRLPEGAWDAWAIWNVRARFLHRGGWAAVEAAAPFTLHADYPFLEPALTAQLWDAIGSESFAAPIALALVFGALQISLLYAGATLLRGRSVGALAAAALCATPMTVEFTAFQYADAPLAAFFLGAALCAAIAVDLGPARVQRLWLLAGVLASMAAWCKNEGIVALLALGAALAIDAGWRAVRPFLIGAAPLLALLAAYKLAIPATNDLVAAAGVHSLRRLIDPARWSIVARHAVHVAANWQRWGPFLAAAPLVVAALLAARPLPASARLIVRALLFLGFAELVVYLTTPSDLAWHLETSADRLLQQAWPTALLATALTLFERRPQSVTTPSRA